MPNRWGLFDMVGNLWERCWDFFQSPLAPATLIDPEGPAAGSLRVARGGAYASGCFDTVSGFRLTEGVGRTPMHTFRVVCGVNDRGARPDPPPAGDDQQRIAAVGRAIAANPDDPLLYWIRSQLNAQAARWPEALADLIRAAEMLATATPWAG